MSAKEHEPRAAQEQSATQEQSAAHESAPQEQSATQEQSAAQKQNATHDGKRRAFSATRLRASFAYALRGVVRLLAREPNARLHLLAAAGVLALASWLQLPARDFAVLALSIGAVLLAEGLNSALEALADRVSPEHDAAIARAKDLAAGAVLLMAIAAATVGLLLLAPPLLARLQTCW